MHGQQNIKKNWLESFTNDMLRSSSRFTHEANYALLTDCKFTLPKYSTNNIIFVRLEVYVIEK